MSQDRPHYDGVHSGETMWAGKYDDPDAMPDDARWEPRKPVPIGSLPSDLLADPWSEPWRRGIERDEEEVARMRDDDRARRRALGILRPEDV